MNMNKLLHELLHEQTLVIRSIKTVKPIPPCYEEKLKVYFDSTCILKPGE